MSKAVSRGQALQIAARVATQVNWDEREPKNLPTSPKADTQAVFSNSEASIPSLTEEMR